MGRPVARLAVAASLLSLLSAHMAAGCSFSPHDLPLPGGPDIGDRAYTVTAEFADVMDLVPRSSVKLADVTVGEVDEIGVENGVAKVSMRVRSGIRLPADTTARIRQTSLLGEKFVSLAPPAQGDGTEGGRLRDGDLIPLDRTGRAVEVEEVLSALSALLNGGGVAQLKTIQVEVNRALDGREGETRQVLRRLDRVLGELDDQRTEIVDAIEKLDALAAELRTQTDTIGAALDDLPPALEVLADQRAQLTDLLVELSELGEVGTRVIEGSKADLLANLEALDPILTELADAGPALPQSLQVLFTYPFADSTYAAIQGDYTNLHLTLDVNMEQILSGRGPVALPTELPLPPGPEPEPTAEVSGGPTPSTPDPEPTGQPRPTEEPTATADPSPTSLLPCLPLLCGGDAGGDAAAAGDAADAADASTVDRGGEIDPELARLLVGPVLAASEERKGAGR